MLKQDMERLSLLNDLLGQYKTSLDFSDKMQASNYKWINNAILYFQRKDKETWVEESVQLLEGAVFNATSFKQKRQLMNEKGFMKHE